MSPPAKIPRQKTGASGRTAKSTDAMLRTWKALGQAGIVAEGGFDGAARQYGVASASLRNYLRAGETLTKRAVSARWHMSEKTLVGVSQR
ncbi:hypothetical protein PHO31112_03277 [Pandoraea horticolens]|uniref:Uncharacterized protein n=1 Tax=Pandoraea horticolens TaxID=2508298 RepID=A0A5E4WK08_9BURK|nr:hypothetical protein PHO31112_03277 [Pandoraea horticolens]